MCQASEYLGLYREFASHGHIVFALDMIDGSTPYTELEDGTPVEFDRSVRSPDDFIEKFEKRVTQVSNFIDDMSSADFL